MSDFNDLIHDARQVDLEEMIMTNETPMYLVPGTVTPEMERRAEAVVFDKYGREILWTDFHAYMTAIATPIQPFADVETVSFMPSPPVPVQIMQPTIGTSETVMMSISAIPLVRRTDMEAQVARVAAEKEMWKQRYERIRWRFLQDDELVGGDLTADEFDASVDADDEARAALNEGAAA